MKLYTVILMIRKGSLTQKVLQTLIINFTISVSTGSIQIALSLQICEFFMNYFV